MKKLDKFIKSKHIHFKVTQIEKISVTNGVEMEYCHENFYYPSKPFTPKNEWKKLERKIYNAIVSSNNTDRFSIKSRVEVINLENLLKKYLLRFHDNLEINNFLNNLTLVERFVDSNDFVKLATDVKKFIIDVLDKDIIRQFLAVNEVDQFTTTIDYAGTKEKVGLHLDNWCKYDFNNRQNSPNRICINLGNESRYLLLYNLSILEMYSLLSEKSKESISSVSSSIGNLFMEENPNYPILRIEIMPFEGYIAPTEMVIHDGSTIGQKYIDLCLHYIVD